MMNKKIEKPNILIVIAARKGSKRIPNKNIKLLDGIPLMVYSIEQAKKWAKYTEIVCSTDDKEIRDIAIKQGCKIPLLRPGYLANDKCGKIDVIERVLIDSEVYFKKTFHIIIDLDVTNPIRTVQDIDNCMRMFKEKRPDVLFSVTKSRYNPYFNMVEKQGNTIKLVKYHKDYTATQELPPVYDINCNIYIYSRDFLMTTHKKSLTSSNNLMIYEMGELSGFNIDVQSEFDYVEYLIKNDKVDIHKPLKIN